ncbi:MAG: hypothetical protein IMW91_05150, partial [Firmicutes bacterium]|nr:hypothetical protein [Bacillota bacterium]
RIFGAIAVLLLLFFSNVQSYRAAFYPGQLRSEPLLEMQNYDAIVAYLDAHPQMRVLCDQEAAFPILLRTANPKRFVITSDRDFKRVLHHPTTYVDAVLVPKPLVETASDAVLAAYPTLWEGKAPFQVSLLVAGTGDLQIRLYALQKVFGN